MDLDANVCERARLARDPRFDGRFFVGVRTTGIYCRPICPARQPKPANVVFFPSAAAAAAEGFRPCLRCRPEAAPGTPAWSGTSATVSRALQLIDRGALDDEGVERLAGRLGVSARHLNRVFRKHLGAPPVAVAQTRRLHFAKKLIDETELPMAEVAHAARFGSVRRFNAVFREAYGFRPSRLRRAGGRRKRLGELAEFRLSLPFRPPFDWSALIDFLTPRAIPGVEAVSPGSYRRTIALGGRHGTLEVRPAAAASHLQLRIRFADPKLLLEVVGRVRRQFDLEADPEEIAGHLEQDPDLARLVRKSPGLRLPGAWDGFELAVRAVLGQQVTVAGATTLAGRLVEAHGEANGEPEEEGTCRLFPEPARLAVADLARLGMPRRRAEAIRRLASAVAEGAISFGAQVDSETLIARLQEIPGIGDWTAQYVAMRCLGAPDAFPASDLGLLRALGDASMTPARLRRRAERWRPWRAYAALHLWRRYAGA